MPNRFQGRGRIKRDDEARPALLRCLKALQDGETLTVWKLDKLGRSLRDLITTLDDLKQRGVKFRSLTEQIDTDTPSHVADDWRTGGTGAEPQ